MPLQGRKFCGILYLDTETYKVDEVLERIKSYFDLVMAYQEPPLDYLYLNTL